MTRAIATGSQGDYPRPVIEAGTRMRPPGAVAVAMWLDAWLRGAAGADDLVTVLTDAAPDCPAVGLAPAGSLEVLLRTLRADRTATAWPLLPRPGRTLGWPVGQSGEPRPAILLGGAEHVALGLLMPTGGGWRLTSASWNGASPAATLSAEALPPRAASRRFVELLADATAELEALGLDRVPSRVPSCHWAAALRHLPACCPPDLVAMMRRIGQVLDGLELGLGDDGAAVTAAEATARSGHLRRLHGDCSDLMVAAIVGASLRS